MGGRFRFSVVTFLSFVTLFIFAGGWYNSKGKTVKWVVWSRLPSTFDPYADSVPRGRIDINAMFSSLYDIRGKDFGPQIARKMECCDNECRIYLRKGITFHDGRMLTAEDVAFSLKKAMQMRGYRAAILRRKIKKVEVESDTVLHLICSDFPVDLKMVLVFPIVPKYWYKDPERYRIFCRRPVGSGPFRFRKVILPDRLIVGSFASFFLGRPKIDKIEFLFFEPDRIKNVGELLGDVDIVMFVPRPVADLVKQLPEYSILEKKESYRYTLVFSLKGSSVFRSKNVRKAISLFLKHKEKGAEKLLRLAGWRKVGGRWIDLSGHPLQIKVFSPLFLVEYTSLQKLRLSLMEEGIDFILARNSDKANAYLICLSFSKDGMIDPVSSLYLKEFLTEVGEKDVLEQIEKKGNMVVPMFDYIELHIFRRDLRVRIGKTDIFSCPWMVYMLEKIHKERG